VKGLRRVEILVSYSTGGSRARAAMSVKEESTTSTSLCGVLSRPGRNEKTLQSRVARAPRVKRQRGYCGSLAVGRLTMKKKGGIGPFKVYTDETCFSGGEKTIKKNEPKATCCRPRREVSRFLQERDLSAQHRGGKSGTKRQALKRESVSHA